MCYWQLHETHTTAGKPSQFSPHSCCMLCCVMQFAVVLLHQWQLATGVPAAMQTALIPLNLEQPVSAPVLGACHQQLASWMMLQQQPMHQFGS